MAKKDAVSKRLAREIALAELLKTVPPFFTLEELPAPELPAPELPAPELPAPPALEELPALLQLGGPTMGGWGRLMREAPQRNPFLTLSRPLAWTIEALATGALWSPT
jgi:hypothetical protein